MLKYSNWMRNVNFLLGKGNANKEGFLTAVDFKHQWLNFKREGLL